MPLDRSTALVDTAPGGDLRELVDLPTGRILEPAAHRTAVESDDQTYLLEPARSRNDPTRVSLLDGPRTRLLGTMPGTPSPTDCQATTPVIICPSHDGHDLVALTLPPR
jgi:hypothetical protein